jgi:hypothetical protein
MGKRWLGLGAGCVLVLSGCYTTFERVTPEMKSAFAKGDVVLDCQLQCELTWFDIRPRLAVLHDLEKWRELADEVIRLGYLNDLAYYYLGRAAEGLRHYDAALKYYRASAGVNKAPGLTGAGRCNSRGQGACNGLNLPADLQPRIVAVEKALGIYREPPRVPVQERVPLAASPRKTTAKKAPAQSTRRKETPVSVQAEPPTLKPMPAPVRQPAPATLAPEPPVPVQPAVPEKPRIPVSQPAPVPVPTKSPAPPVSIPPAPLAPQPAVPEAPVPAPPAAGPGPVSAPPPDQPRESVPTFKESLPPPAGTTETRFKVLIEEKEEEN